MGNILTFDLGTTYFKAVVFDEQGKIRALARRTTPTEQPQPNYSEIPIDRFHETIIKLVDDLRQQAAQDVANVLALSFATQTNSFVLLGDADQPLTNIILWTDQRARNQDWPGPKILNSPDYYARTGLPRLNPKFMLAKLYWLKTHQPKLWAQARRVCLISDYLTLWLTGRHATEAGTAGLTGALDIHTLQWHEPTLSTLDIDPDWMPDVVRAGTDLGPLTSQAATDLQLPADCRFVVGCLDQYAGAIGAGNVTPGNLSETTGTVLACVRCSDKFKPAFIEGLVQGPAFEPGLFFQMVCGNISANVLEAYRNSLPDQPSYEVLTDEASRVPPSADGLRLDVSTAGTGPPAFIGRQPQHGRGHEVRAILEAVAEALSDQIAVLCGSTLPTSLQSVGGAARSDLWLQTKADKVQIPVIAPECPEPTSLGAAMLAFCALKKTPLKELTQHWVRVRRTLTPGPQTAK